MALQLNNTHYFLKIMWLTHALPEPQAQWRVGESEIGPSCAATLGSRVQGLH
jgi:hypothetical protein